MHTTKLRKVGGSVMLAVPPVLLNLLQLKVGATVAVDVEHGRLIVEPKLIRSVPAIPAVDTVELAPKVTGPVKLAPAPVARTL